MSAGIKFYTEKAVPESFLTVEELSKWLNVPMSWIYDRIRSPGINRIPHYKLGRHVRFSIPEIEDYLRIRSVPESIFTKDDVRDRETKFLRI